MFAKFAAKVTEIAGSAPAFGASLALIIGWLVSGPFLHFSELWQLSVNTATTIITFLMVFLIQHSQNKDTRSLHAKLDELLRAVEGAREHPPGVEDD
jgi:low affinity Fe/Cu permease